MFFCFLNRTRGMGWTELGLEEKCAEAYAELEKERAKVALLTAYLDKIEPFWRNRVAGFLQ